MGLSDPFSQTYQGSMQAGESLGQGIQSATGSVADVMKQKNAQAQQDKQRQKAFGMLKDFGLVKTSDPTNDDLAKGLQDYGQKAGVTVNVNHGDNPDVERKNMMAIYKAMGIPMPKGKIDVNPGVSMDMGGGVSYTAPSKTSSLIGQLGMMKEKDKKDNVAAISDAIENGDQLADFQSLYGLAGPVKAELERRGVKVGDLQLNALAEKKFVQTLNSPAQTRLRQIIPSVTDGLDILDSLNNDFQRTGIKAFNKAELEALSNGSGTKEQQEVAAKFVTQLSVLSDEAGSLFMNGNTPTDKSIELFQKIVKGDYNDTTINSAIKQLKVNLNIRKNAIEHTGAVGINGPINQDNSSSQMMNATPGMNNQGKVPDVSTMSDDQLKALANG